MSDDLIERLRKPHRQIHRSTGRVVEKSSPAIQHEAADALAAKDTALSAFMIRNSFATGHGDAFADLLAELEWQVKERSATLSEMRAELERVKKALEPFAKEGDAWVGYDDTEALTEGWGGGPATQLNVGHLRRAARALAPSIQETDLGVRG